MPRLKHLDRVPFTAVWSIGNSEKARKDAEVIQKSVRNARSLGTSKVVKPTRKEIRIVEAVTLYFSESKFSKFSMIRACRIQMGAIHSSADIVLRDKKGNCIAIAECKLQGRTDYGPEQLKSFLCATDTPFGIFASSTNKDSWIFYENLRHNRFRQIEQSDFEKGILESVETDRLCRRRKT